METSKSRFCQKKLNERRRLMERGSRQVALRRGISSAGKDSALGRYQTRRSGRWTGTTCHYRRTLAQRGSAVIGRSRQKLEIMGSNGSDVLYLQSSGLAGLA